MELHLLAFVVVVALIRYSSILYLFYTTSNLFYIFYIYTIIRDAKNTPDALFWFYA